MQHRRAPSRGGLKRINVQLDPLTLRRVDDSAALEGISRSFAITKLVREALDARQQAPRKAAS